MWFNVTISEESGINKRSVRADLFHWDVLLLEIISLVISDWGSAQGSCWESTEKLPSVCLRRGSSLSPQRADLFLLAVEITFMFMSLVVNGGLSVWWRWRWMLASLAVKPSTWFVTAIQLWPVVIKLAVFIWEFCIAAVGKLGKNTCV